MNNLDITKCAGILNHISGSGDFFSDYEPVVYTAVYKQDRDILTDSTASMTCVFFKVIDKDLHFEARVPYHSYMSVKSFSEKTSDYMPEFHSVVNKALNHFSVNTVLSFVKEEREGKFESYLLFEKDGEFLFTNVKLTDAVCLSFCMDMPLLFHRGIVDKLAVCRKDFEQRIVERSRV